MSELVLEKNKNLPKCWEITNLGFVVQFIVDKDHTTPRYVKSDGIPLISPKDFIPNSIDFSKPKLISKAEHDDICKKCNPKVGDLLYSRIGTIGEVRKVPVNKIFNILHSIVLIRPNSEVALGDYLFYILQSNIMKNQARRDTKSIGTPDLGITKIRNFIIPLPPLNEQKRIVSKIEELFSRLDSTVDSLRKTKLQLKSQKSSLLKSGFLGELTKDRRNKNSYDSVEPLMEKIKNIKNKQERKLQKILLPERDEVYFHQIPDSWKWIRVGNVCLRLQYGTSEKANDDFSGIPVLRMGNIIDGELNFSDLKFFPKNWNDKDEFLLEPQDILFNRTNSAELVGKTAMYKSIHTPSVFASYLIRAKVESEIMMPEILSYYTNSIFGKMFIKSVVSQQVGQANVNGTKFAMMRIPLIPMDEQVELIGKIDTGLSLIQNIVKEVEIRLQNLSSLKMSILKNAFEGKLVPQDPNDEPAEILLQKIKQEKDKLQEIQKVIKVTPIKARRMKYAK